MIAFPCPSCRQPLSVKQESAGKSGVCPHCKQRLTVPAPAAQPAEAATIAGPQSSSEAAGEKLDFLAPPQQPEELGRLGPYRIVKVLGSGGMGLVLQALDPKLNRAIALKVMRPALAANAVQRQRFLREAQATAAIEHDHIVAIYQVGQANGVPFIAMPFLKGEALDARLQREGRLPVAEAVRIAREMAEGLAAAHERGLIHRDVKPANVWLEAPRGRVKIVDFGLARSASDDVQLTQEGIIVGTPAFMAPEQAQAGTVDGRADLYSLGAVLYRLLTGELPFPGNDLISLLAAVLTQSPRPVRELRPDVPAALAELVMQLLAKEPAQRPTTALAVADALGACTEDATQTLANGPLPRRAGVQPLARIRGRARWLIAGMTGVGLLVLLGFLLGPDRELAKELTNTLGMKLVLVPKGKFLMGGGGGTVGAKEVEIPHDFYLGKYEVTQGEWEAVTGSNPSHFSRTEDGKDAVKDIADADLKQFPVENVSWNDTHLFLEALNAREKQAGWLYRLPKETEWEYACRGGPTSNKFDYGFDFYFAKPSNQLLPGQANCKDGKGLERTCQVGRYQPNRLGLYDMHGNVWEWCDDSEKAADGALQRVFRGGSWEDDAGTCAAAVRNSFPPTDHYGNFGFRLARVPVGK